MSYNYMTHTLQAHDCLMELKGILQPYREHPQAAAWLADVERLDKKLENMHFQVAIVGEFKRGKTSLINALLRRRVLPADVVPTTATLNRITYGDTPASYVFWKDDRPPEQIDIGQLAGYITKLTDDAARQAHNIREAVVRYPCRFCEHNVDLIDTPGMNDDDVMNNVTIQGLSDIDLAIVALEPVSPVSNTEARFIAHLVENEQICQIIFVLSKIDTVFEEEREPLIRAVRARLKTCVRAVLLETHPEGDPVLKKFDALFADVILFPVSAMQALAAYDMGDKQALERSGFRRLSDELLPLIIRSQHSAAVLTPLRAVARMAEDFRRLLAQWAEETAAAEQLQVMKTQVAQTAYSPAVDLGQVWTVCCARLEERKRDHIDGAYRTLMDALSTTADSALLVAKVKELFRQISQYLAREELESYRQLRADHLRPPYEALARQLSRLLEPRPDFLERLAPQLAGLIPQDPEQEEAPEPFYWERSPIPPPDAKRGQFPYLVESAVRLSLDSYFLRRQARLSQILRSFHGAQEKLLVGLVQEVFRMANAEAEPADRLPVTPELQATLSPMLTGLALRCRAVEEDYLSHTDCIPPTE